MSYTWRFELFGKLRACRGNQIVDRFVTQKAAVLLGYLVLNKGRTHPREELIEFLWPESHPEEFRKKLNYTLWAIRRQLEPPGIPSGAIIVSDRHTVRLNTSNISSDTAEFESHIKLAQRNDNTEERKEQLIQAVDLYEGQLLPGFHEDWIVAERQRLEDMCLGALKELVTTCKDSGSRNEAVHYAQRVISINKLDEDTHCDLMRLYVELGQPAQVQKQFSELQEVLKSELGVAPSKEAVKLNDEARLNPLPAAKKSVVPQRSSTDHIEAPLSKKPLASVVKASRRQRDVLLPLQLTRFFGRDADLSFLRNMLQDMGIRLISLVGIGGCGKTRLAVEAGLQCQSTFAGGIYFVPLAEVSSAHHIPSTIVRSLDLQTASGTLELDTVIDALKRRSEKGQVLLILDNYEHLIEEGTSVLLQILDGVPDLSCLITSRHTIGIQGEHEFPVEPLPIPQAEGKAITPENLMTVPSVQLFVDRAQAARVYFQVTPRNCAEVASLCEKLEGLPLSIEIAAALVQMLTPAQIIEQLANRFDLLLSRHRDVSPRHRSLRATIDYSYDLLDEDMKALMRKLSIFRGGWTVEGASVVCLDGQPLQKVSSLLADLKDRSLIRTIERPDEMRYQMYETLREYMMDQVSEQEMSSLQLSYVEYYSKLIAEAAIGLEGPSQQDWLKVLNAEVENLRSAINWCITHNQVCTGLQICTNAHRFWISQGLVMEAQQYFLELIAKPEAKSNESEYAKACAILGTLLLITCDFDLAETYCNNARDLSRKNGDKLLESRTLSILGTIYNRTGQAEEYDCLSESLTIAESIGDPSAIARSSTNLATVLIGRGQFDEAIKYLERSRGLLISIGDKFRLATVTLDLGNVACFKGDLGLGERYFMESIEQSIESEYRLCRLDGIINLGLIKAYTANSDAAYSLLNEGLHESIEIGQTNRIFDAIFGLSILQQRLQNPRVASQLFGIADRISEETSVVHNDSVQEFINEIRDELIEDIGPEAFETEYEIGRKLQLDQAIALAKNIAQPELAQKNA